MQAVSNGTSLHWQQKCDSYQDGLIFVIRSCGWRRWHKTPFEISWTEQEIHLSNRQTLKTVHNAYKKELLANERAHLKHLPTNKPFFWTHTLISKATIWQPSDAAVSKHQVWLSFDPGLWVSHDQNEECIKYNLGLMEAYSMLSNDGRGNQAEVPEKSVSMHLPKENTSGTSQRPNIRPGQWPPNSISLHTVQLIAHYSNAKVQ